MAEQDLDRSQAATPYKLQKARERGQIARSADVVSAAVFMAAMVFLTSQGWRGLREQLLLDRAVLIESGHVEASPAALWSLAQRALYGTVAIALPFFGTMVFAAIAASLLQGGAVFSLEPLKPDWTRLNPATGFKRVFSLRTLFHAARALLKLVLLGATVYLALRNLTPHLFAIAGLPALGVLRTLLDDVGSLGLKLAAVLGAIAVLDLVFTHREYARQMRMSRRELRDEIKHREGDPRIRARVRELRRDLLKRTLAVRKTRDADVLITNPTHVAVALRYVHGEMASPQLVAKGAGLLAAAMRRIAARHGIPVVRNPTLARALYHGTPLDRSVPPELYTPVARIIVWVFAMRDASRSRHAALAASAPAGGPTA